MNDGGVASPRAAALMIGSCVLAGACSLPSTAEAQAQIAFVKKGAGAKYSHLWTIAPDGTGLKRITSTSSNDLAPTWSPGRGTIAFMRSKPDNVLDRRARLMLMRSDGSNARVLAYEGPSLTTGSEALAYSPNGRLLAGGVVLRNSGGYWTEVAVTVLNLNAKKSQMIVRGLGMNAIQSLSWSPDSSQLVATTDFGGGYGSMRIDVAKKRGLNSFHGSYGGYGGLTRSASWRPDGEYVLCGIWFIEEPGYPFRTQLLRPDGTVVSTLGDGQLSAVYAPDGQRYAFLQYVTGYAPQSLKVADGDGANVTTIYRGVSGELLSSPAWK